MKKIEVMIFMGSLSDKDKMMPAKKLLDNLGVPSGMRITSAHRTSDRTKDLVLKSMEAGCQVFICGAGMAAHLAGVVASHTIRPVIGVPLTSKASPLNGNDALLSTVQMPSGMPVATVAIDGAKNAAWLAVQILAVSDPDLVGKLLNAREEAAMSLIVDDTKLQTELT